MAKKKAVIKKPSDALKKRTAVIRKKLKEAYPEVRTALDSDNPYQLLCSTILAAQCTDKRVNQDAPALYAEFPNATALAKADPERVKELIKSLGFFNQKTKSLISMANDLVEKHDGEVPGTMEELVKLRGVGRKTAWCVLSTYFGESGIIVDTHCKRVSARLGLHEESDPVKIEKALDALIPKKERADFAHRLVYHGRQICDARKPKCGECFLVKECPSAEV